MIYLWIATLIFALSFSLVGSILQGVNPYMTAFIRSCFAILCFLPFLRFQHLKSFVAPKLILIGGLQLGMMYCFYLSAFQYITVTEIVLFTVMTPVYICIVRDLMKKTINWKGLSLASLSVVGAIVIRYDNITSDFLTGLLLIQGANFCFGLGQYLYSELKRDKAQQHQDFALFYLGAILVSGLAFASLGEYTALSTKQWSVLFYLGVIASGLAYFFWNKGATKVNTETLAIMNQVLTPMGIFVNLVFFNGQADMPRLLVGTAIIFASLYFANKAYQSAN